MKPTKTLLLEGHDQMMKILPCGVAVIAGDTHISAWVEQSQTLRIAEKMLAPFRKYVPVGGVVVDAGAMIGDHTVTYADWVGENGSVIAFEPNPQAFECLKHNTEKLSQVWRIDMGLSDKYEFLSMRTDKNAGASNIIDSPGEVSLVPLDKYALPRLSFLKIDVEGFETRLLKGAVETIEGCRPVILAEVNSGALVRAGSSSGDLLDKLNLMGYRIERTDPNISWISAQFDVICIPKERL